MTVAEIPPTSAITDQLPKLVGHVVSKMNQKALIRKKASIPLEDFLDVVSAILAKEPNGKQMSQASQSRWLTPTTFDGGRRSK